MFFSKGQGSEQETEVVSSFQTIDKEIIKSLDSELDIENENDIKMMVIYDFANLESSKDKKKRSHQSIILKSLSKEAKLASLSKLLNFHLKVAK